MRVTRSRVHRYRRVCVCERDDIRRLYCVSTSSDEHMSLVEQPNTGGNRFRQMFVDDTFFCRPSIFSAIHISLVVFFSLIAVRKDPHARAWIRFPRWWIPICEPVFSPSSQQASIDYSRRSLVNELRLLIRPAKRSATRYLIAYYSANLTLDDLSRRFSYLGTEYDSSHHNSLFNNGTANICPPIFYEREPVVRTSETWVSVREDLEICYQQIGVGRYAPARFYTWEKSFRFPRITCWLILDDCQHINGKTWTMFASNLRLRIWTFHVISAKDGAKTKGG